MNETVEKLDFFDQIAYSVQPSKYAVLGAQPRRKVIMYLLNLATILSIMTFIIPIAGFLLGVGGPQKLIMEDLPAIELRNGNLTVEHKLELGRGSASHLLVDTSINRAEVSDLDPEQYSTEIIVTKTNIMMFSKSTQALEYDFTKVPDLTLNNETLLSLMPYVVIVFILSFIINIFRTAWSYLLTSGLIAIACWGPFSLRGTKRLSYFKALTYSIYSHTVYRLVLAFNSCAGLVKNPTILVYAGIFLSMGLLISGIRKAEGLTNE